MPAMIDNLSFTRSVKDRSRVAFPPCKGLRATKSGTQKGWHLLVPQFTRRCCGGWLFAFVPFLVASLPCHPARLLGGLPPKKTVHVKTNPKSKWAIPLRYKKNDNSNPFESRAAKESPSVIPPAQASFSPRSPAIADETLRRCSTRDGWHSQNVRQEIPAPRKSSRIVRAHRSASAGRPSARRCPCCWPSERTPSRSIS